MDKEYILYLLGIATAVLGWFVRQFAERVDRIENSFHHMANKQSLHDKDLQTVASALAEIKDTLRAQEARRETLLQELARNHSEIMGEIRLIQHRLGAVEEEKK